MQSRAKVQVAETQISTLASTGDSGKRNIAFKKAETSSRPVSRWVTICLDQLAWEREKEKELRWGLGIDKGNTKNATKKYHLKSIRFLIVIVLKKTTCDTFIGNIRTHLHGYEL